MDDLLHEAAARDMEGRSQEAALLYERAFCQAVELRVALPPFVVGRLAVLYRRLGQFDNEIFLLERYRDSLIDDDLQARYRARLTKAYSLAAQHRGSDSVALASVRASTERSIGKRRVRVSTTRRSQVADPRSCELKQD